MEEFNCSTSLALRLYHLSMQNRIIQGPVFMDRLRCLDFLGRRVESHCIP
jgi:hypothetical protein